MAIEMAVSTLKKANGQFSKTNSEMQKLVGMSDEMAHTTEQCLATVNLCISMMEVGLGVQKLIDMATKEREVAQAAILTAANSFTPIGWAKIALATTASVGVGAAIGYIANSSSINPTLEQKITADLSTASGRTAVSQLVGVMA